MKSQIFAIAKAIIILLLVVVTAACGSSPVGPTAPSASADTTGGATAPAAKLNLNTATDADFLTIPGVGNRMVREFMEYRPYTSIQQFRREIGKYVDAAQVAEYEKYVFVPVDVNQADVETLKQLPGVTDAIAADLVAGRPYASNDDFLAKLAGQLSADDLATAKNYLATP
jgi:DNA uptake protein ComE-like DNA-binding protein